MKIGALGDIVFEFSEIYSNSIEELARSSSWKYAEHEIIKGKSRLQRLGRELDTVNFRGRFIDSFCDPIEEIRKLKNEAEKDQPLMLVIGEEIFGKFVIESISESWISTEKDGKPKIIEFEVILREYN